MAILNFQKNKQKKAHHHVLKLMGCKFILTAIHDNPDLAWKAILAGVAEIERIENLISSWKDDSQTNRINQMAGKQAVKVDRELFDLIKRSLQLSQWTNGAFDISGTLSRYYWDFNGLESQALSPEKLKELCTLINFRNIVLDDERQTVYLRKEGMKIGFGAIGKGYAALMAKQVMESLGIEDGLVNASGDLICWGQPGKEKAWEIKITDPEDKDYVLATLNIDKGAIVTSGGYENYTLINGEKYSHIVDPRTAWPVVGLKSVSIICPNPELGDALATAVTVLGEKKGMALINRLKGIECLIVNHDNELIYSDNLSHQNYK